MSYLVNRRILSCIMFYNTMSIDRCLVTQQKQIDHSMVTLVADKLMRQWLCIVYFANCIRQPERKVPRPTT